MSNEALVRPPRRPARPWRRRLALASGVALGTLLVGSALGATWFWSKAQTLFAPTPVRVSPTVMAYAEESPPPIPEQAREAPFDWSSITTPPRGAFPRIRWWWPGADVEPTELRRELEQLRGAGFSGVEIQPFTMGTFAVSKDDPAAGARVNSVDQQRYFDLVRGVLSHAKQLGMSVDLTHYSGWPGGSPAVTPAENSQSLAWSEHRFTGGKRVTIPIPKPKPGLNAWGLALASMYYGLGDFGDFDPAAAKLVSVLVARPTGGGHSMWSTQDSQSLDPKSVRVVDGLVRNGELTWDAPAGDWLLVASWILPTGEQASLAATGNPTYIIDPLNARAVDAEYNYIFGRRTGFSAFYGSPLRAIFNDSLEFKADRISSRDFLREFQERRGYDLRPWLPAVYRSLADNFTLGGMLPRPAPDFKMSGDDERVRHDYQQTLSDLIVERFVDRSRRWANARGLLSRGQSYGMDLDILAALGANDIPETEQLYAGGSDAFLRFASSGAMLYGRSRVSAESFVWRDQDYASSGAKLKAAADKLFLAGVNEIIYHGYPYDWRRADRARWFSAVGWDPWSAAERSTFIFSGNYSERTPLWADLPTLNSYMGRVQNLLRQGSQRADVLIYYPFLGFPPSDRLSEYTHEGLLAGRFELTDPVDGKPNGKSAQGGSTDERILWLRRVQPLLDALSARGLTWSWVNDDAIRSRLGPDGRIGRGATFGALVFADTPSVASDTLARAKALAAGRLPVLVHGSPPYRQPGFHDAREGDRRVRSIAEGLASARPLAQPVAEAADQIMRLAKPAYSYQPSDGIRRYRRELDGASIDFFANGADGVRSVSLTDVPAGAWWFDALSGQSAPVRSNAGRTVLELPAYGSQFLVAGAPMPKMVGTGSLGLRPARIWRVNGWRMSAAGRNWTGLPDWLREDSLRTFGQAARYEASVVLPALRQGARFVLRVPPQTGTAAAAINGRPIGGISVPPAAPDVTALLRPGLNRITVTYRGPVRNALIGAAQAGDRRVAHFKDRSKELVPAGLRGGFEIVELVP